MNKDINLMTKLDRFQTDWSRASTRWMRKVMKTHAVDPMRVSVSFPLLDMARRMDLPYGHLLVLYETWIEQTVYDEMDKRWDHYWRLRVPETQALALHFVFKILTAYGVLRHPELDPLHEPPPGAATCADVVKDHLAKYLLLNLDGDTPHVLNS